ncbi:hypothetical protein Tco_0242896 [Tanacetum coccineum]
MNSQRLRGKARKISVLPNHAPIDTTVDIVKSGDIDPQEDQQTLEIAKAALRKAEGKKTNDIFSGFEQTRKEYKRGIMPAWQLKSLILPPYVAIGGNGKSSTDTPCPPVGYDVSTLPLRIAYRSLHCMTRSSTKELITPFGNPERVFRSKRRLFETHDLVESSSPELGLFSDIEEHSEEETTEIMTETME